MTADKADGAIVRLIEPKQHDIEGLLVRRALPSIRQRTIGPFVFVDHMGPATSSRPLVNVPPHPHIGIATITYLFEGKIRHQDSLGHDQVIEPGGINYMHAGRGIVHSEHSSMEARPNPPPDRLHGLQFWLALEPDEEDTDPFFSHWTADQVPLIEKEGVQLRVLVGSCFDVASPIEAPLNAFIADLHLQEGAVLQCPARAGTEQAIYLATGTVNIDGQEVSAPRLIVLGGESSVRIDAKRETRAVLFGGDPLSERRHMDWNFVSTRRERLLEARAQYRDGLLGYIPRGGKNLPHPEDARAQNTPPEPSSDYLDRLLRRESFAAIRPLFSKATKPAKELTESFSALEHLRPLMRKVGPCRAIHVGDGAHARTAALFALKTDSDNISVDPLVNERIVEEWRDTFDISRFEWRKSRIEDVTSELNALPSLPTFVTFVHAHVNTERVLSELKWDVAFVLVCCMPGKQLATSMTPYEQGEDMCVLSPERKFQTLVNRASTYAHLFNNRA